jgi:molybdopterin molybdotransferase
MDGYALAGAELPTDSPKRFPVVGTVFAGRPFHGRVAPGQCVRIMTGAVLPEGTDTVVVQEVVTPEGQHAVWVPPRQRPGQNVRPPDEDIAKGALVLEGGTLLGPGQLGVLASLGIRAVEVFPRVRAALFSTGDELKEVGQKLKPGELYDSNRYVLRGLLVGMGAKLVRVGHLPDTPKELGEELLAVSEKADLIITTGGVSVGEKDLVRETVAKVGRMEFSQVAVKPGKPLVFGSVGKALFFGLPGNPVSSFVAFCVFVRPALDRLRGRREPPLPPLWARSVQDFSRRSGRREYLRGRLTAGPTGEPTVEIIGPLGSFALSSVARANCLIVLKEDQEEVRTGDLLQVLPFEGLLPIG